MMPTKVVVDDVASEATWKVRFFAFAIN